MHIKIVNMLRVTEAELDLHAGRITCVSGANATGKTSLATLAAGILCRNGNPLSAGKGAGKVYLTDDTDSGGVELTDGGQPLARWVGSSGEVAEFVPEHPLAPSSPGAVGLIDFCASMSGPARTALWEAYFLPPIAKLRDMIERQLKPHLNAKRLADIMKLVDGGDMSAVAKSYEGRARDEKSFWQRLTGENWGIAKAADWIPAGWTADLDGETVETAEKGLAAAREGLQAHHVEHAVSVSEVARAREAADGVPASRRALEDAQAAYSAAADTLTAEKGALARLEGERTELRTDFVNHKGAEPREQNHWECPHCKGAVVAASGGGGLRAYDPTAVAAEHSAWALVTEEKEKAIEANFATIAAETQRLAPFREIAATTHRAVGVAEGELAAIRRQAAGADDEPTGDMAEAVEAAEAAVERARACRDLVALRADTQQHHQDIVEYQMIARILGPKGVRATAMQEAMNSLDGVLETIAKITAWPRVALDRSFAVSIGKRTVMKVCAESERLRAQWSLQIAIARCKRETVVILDAADHLDADNLEGLKRLLDALCGRPQPPAFMVCGTNFDMGEFNPAGPNHMLRDGKLGPSLGGFTE